MNGAPRTTLPGRCKHGYQVRDDDPSVQACIDREAATPRRMALMGGRCAAEHRERGWWHRLLIWASR